MKEDLNIIQIETEQTRVDVVLKNSARAKRLSIKITPYGAVELVVPKRISNKKAVGFLHDNKNWVLNKMASMKFAAKKNIQNGSKISIQGKEYIIKHSGKTRGVSFIENNEIIVSGDEGLIAKKVEKFLKELAKKILKKYCDFYANNLGVEYNKITIKDTKTRWGSCSKDKNLSFSWRLILAEEEILKYVAAHEVAHILQMNHSDKFWAVVKSVYPEYKKARLWLNKNGQSLHEI